MVSTHLDTFADDLVVDFFDEVFAVDEFGFGPNPYLVRLEIRHFHQNFFLLFVPRLVVRRFRRKRAGTTRSKKLVD